MKILTISLLLTLAILPISQTQAQRSGSNRYEEPSKFPVLRKAFRQIRGDVRYHAKTIRETASDIRHDVTSTIRGEVATPQYGYRGEQSYDGHQADYNRNQRRQPVPSYEEYYEEPPIYQPQPAPRNQIERRAPVRREVKSQPEPRIVAPKPQTAPTRNIEPKQPAWMNDPRVKNPSPKVETKPSPKPKITPKTKSKYQPKPAPKPEPKPEPKFEPEPKPEPKLKPEIKSEVVKKDTTYPTAKRSDRSGFHHSPFPPYELLDTQGIQPGELARDPGNGKIFRVPK